MCTVSSFSSPAPSSSRGFEESKAGVALSPSAAGVPRSEFSPSVVLSSAEAIGGTDSVFPKTLVDGELTNEKPPVVEGLEVEKKLDDGGFSGTPKGFEELAVSDFSVDFSAGLPKVKEVAV